jgi:hypothetical protein
MKFIEIYKDCPWMVTASAYAKACYETLKAGDYSGLEELNDFGRQYGPFPEELEFPT